MERSIDLAKIKYAVRCNYYSILHIMYHEQCYKHCNAHWAWIGDAFRYIPVGVANFNAATHVVRIAHVYYMLWLVSTFTLLDSGTCS